MAFIGVYVADHVTEVAAGSLATGWTAEHITSNAEMLRHTKWYLSMPCDQSGHRLFYSSLPSHTSIFSPLLLIVFSPFRIVAFRPSVLETGFGPPPPHSLQSLVVSHSENVFGSFRHLPALAQNNHCSLASPPSNSPFNSTFVSLSLLIFTFNHGVLQVTGHVRPHTRSNFRTGARLL